MPEEKESSEEASFAETENQSEEKDIFDEAGSVENKELPEKPRKQRKPRKQKIKIVDSEENEEPEKKLEMKETIKKVIIAKAVDAAKKDETEFPVLDKELGTKELYTKASEKKEKIEESTPELGFLAAEGQGVFIGRKKSVFEKYGMDAALFVGKIVEKQMEETSVFLDGLNPHAVFVCGSRGSGKSYFLGVLAEELALKNQNVGIVVIDPVGVFWSMKFPNREEKELESLAKWEMLPQGLGNTKVFIPEGMKDKAPKETFDATFSVQPSLLTPDDWCLTFGIDRFSPTGLLLEKVMQKIRTGYKTKEGKEVKGKRESFSLEELIDCLVKDTEVNSMERGFKPDSIRALVSRFESAKYWGVFSEKGTPLSEISNAGQLSVIDTSFLDDNVSALVIGILARRILAARKLSTRKAAAQRFKEEDASEFLELEIPPTWLFIDEAHTLIPSGNMKTPASSALVEYVKQGRQPGCSIIFATQQPSAIDTRVLSQLDIILTHKLVFDDDIKAVFKRTPTIIPRAFKHSSFIKTLPVGVSVVGDRREETKRAFVMKTRPRMSQHEGREAVTLESKQELDNKQVRKLAAEIGFAQLEKENSLSEKNIAVVVERLNKKYNASVSPEDVVSDLEKKGAVVNPKTGILFLPGKELKKETIEVAQQEPEMAVQEEARQVLGKKTVLVAFPTRVDEKNALRLADSFRKKKILGLFGKEERIEKLVLKYLPVYKIEFNYFNSKNAFNQGAVFVDSFSGEFIHFDSAKNEFVESNGLKEISGLADWEVKVLLLIGENKIEEEALFQKTREPEARAKRAVRKLVELDFVGVEKVAETNFYFVKKRFDLPPNPLHPMLESLSRLSVSEVEALELQRELVEKATVAENLKKLWKKLVVTNMRQIYLPFYEAVLKAPDGSTRRLWIEAVTGKEMGFIK